MARRDSELSDDQMLGLAFEHVGQLARLLHASGHSELAALLDGVADVGELQRRRLARSDDTSGDPAVLDYVIEQLGDLSTLMERHGQSDIALLLRFPGQFAAARSDLAAPGDPLHRSAEANDAP